MRNLLKKLAFVSCLLACLMVCFSGCKSQNFLLDRLVDSRVDIFEAKCDFFPLKATYGFKETPYQTDGVISNKEYYLDFKIVGHSYSNVETQILFEHEGQTYKSRFELDPVTHSVKAKILIDNFKEKSFTATIFYGSEKAEVEFKSIVPENSITLECALDALLNEQRALIDSFNDKNGVFCGEITARIIVRNSMPYWYIGISSKEHTKALLIDGTTAKTLAIREIF